MSKTRYKNGEEYYNKLYVFFNATVAITLLPLAILLLKKQSGSLAPLLEDSPLSYSITIILIGCIGFIIWWVLKKYKEQLNQPKREAPLREQLDFYYSINTKKYLFMIIPCVLSVAGYYLTTNGLFIVTYVMTMIFLSLKRPTLTLLIEELKLSDGDKKILVDKLEIV